ncbi:DUF1254 domain-containing protein [Oharaeibacter diazotrophicus]|uniref:Putative membrane protein n=1 Tax=Oharaeibacter diazotrophicus TaxID=1920512 RepID=A0A4R6RC45_9HYPH|nr:hypothetical protein [Oharaeibacter diazotrophicus]TDP83236.1 putative membrane protein [Oharaeibacter diazotrophicus]BBE72069.1 hypothetical protein OHA_1_01656 [Pleomorphomonas sp. SM30]GLS78834.1 hypothetical protein GCM10007904_41710 [Oharaeibacter diazotrophicus]
MIGKIVRAVLGGLFLAGFVHIVAVLAIPVLAERDAVARVAAALAVDEDGAPAPGDGFRAIPADGSVLPDLDPAFVHVVCPFTAADGTVDVAGAMPDTIWSLAVVARGAGIVAAYEHTAAVDGRIEVLVGSPEAVETIRLARAAGGTDTANYAAVDTDRGFVLLRAFADADHPPEALRAALTAVSCRPLDE